MAQSRKVMIDLSAEAHRCLLERISDGSSAHRALIEANHITGNVNVGDRYVVTCDLDDAESLLAAANRECRAAEDDIRTAINLFRTRTSS